MNLPIPVKPLGHREFIALMAMLMATVAYSIDALLPAMGLIAGDLTPQEPVHAQHVVPYFVVGLGVGTLFTGPLSDAFGRRPVVLGGFALFLAGAFWGWMAQSLEALLYARALQGMGASGARVVALAIIRDRFTGREMAKTASLVMMIFTLVPAIAPTIGAALIWLDGWHAICASFLVFALVVGTWFFARQPETLRPERRRPLRFRPILTAVTEIVRHSVVRRVVLVQICVFSMLFTLLSVSQPVFDIVLDRASTFHLWFGAVALVAMSGALLNAKLVVRLGMQRLARSALNVQLAVTFLYLIALWSGVIPQNSVAAFFVWLAVSFATVGMIISNLNAIALEPMSHIAGTASSVITASGTFGAGLITIHVSHLFHDSQVPILVAVLGLIAFARLLLTGAQFRPAQVQVPLPH